MTLAKLPTRYPHVPNKRPPAGSDGPATDRWEYEEGSPLVTGPVPVRASVSDEVMRPDHLLVLPERERSQGTRAGHAPGDLHLPSEGYWDSIEHERPELAGGAIPRTSTISFGAGGDGGLTG